MNPVIPKRAKAVEESVFAGSVDGAGNSRFLAFGFGMAKLLSKSSASLAGGVKSKVP